jgi:hypothetical protein
MNGRTMLPLSVEPRAKMKVIGRQAPEESSLTVEPTLVPNWRGTRSVGSAVAVAARRAKGVVIFMVAVEVGGLGSGRSGWRR